MRVVVVILMIVLGILGVVLLVSGVQSWINLLSSEDIVTGFFGLTFAVAFAVLGGAILLVDLIILLVFLHRRKKERRLQTNN